MGCCLSTSSNKNTKATSAAAAPSGPTKAHLHQSRDRAPPLGEEEAVKEVLSETPKPIVNSQITTIGDTKPPPSHIQLKAAVEIEKDSDFVDDGVSEPARSELSSSTLTNDLSYDEEREVRGPIGRRLRSSPGVASRVNPRARPDWNSGAGRDRVVGRSSSRRSDQSPARRGVGAGSVRMVPSREQSADTGQGVVRRGLRYDSNRKDPAAGEGPAGRRSRSPATNRSAAVGRSPASNRRVSQSPGRVRTDTAENVVGSDGERADENKWPSSNPNLAAESEVNPNESLENPLVSLECFIFL